MHSNIFNVAMSIKQSVLLDTNGCIPFKHADTMHVLCMCYLHLLRECVQKQESMSLEKRQKRQLCWASAHFCEDDAACEFGLRELFLVNVE